jgi:hypothetical protein
MDLGDIPWRDLHNMVVQSDTSCHLRELAKMRTKQAIRTFGGENSFNASKSTQKDTTLANAVLTAVQRFSHKYSITNVAPAKAVNIVVAADTITDISLLPVGTPSQHYNATAMSKTDAQEVSKDSQHYNVTAMSKTDAQEVSKDSQHYNVTAMSKTDAQEVSKDSQHYNVTAMSKTDAQEVSKDSQHYNATASSLMARVTAMEKSISSITQCVTNKVEEATQHNNKTNMDLLATIRLLADAGDNAEKSISENTSNIHMLLQEFSSLKSETAIFKNELVRVHKRYRELLGILNDSNAAMTAKIEKQASADDLVTIAEHQKELLEILNDSNSIMTAKIAGQVNFSSVQDQATAASPNDSMRKIKKMRKAAKATKKMAKAVQSTNQMAKAVQVTKKVTPVSMRSQQGTLRGVDTNFASANEQEFESLCDLLRQADAHVFKTSDVKVLLDQFDTIRQLLNCDPHFRHVFAEFDHRLNEVRNELPKTTTVEFNNTYLAEKLQGIVTQAKTIVEQQIDDITLQCRSQDAFIATILNEIPQIVT